MKIIPYGKLTDIMDSVEISNHTFYDLNSLKSWLFNEFPGLENEDFTVAINQKMIAESQRFDLHDNDEIELLPPFSGG